MRDVGPVSFWLTITGALAAAPGLLSAQDGAAARATSPGAHGEWATPALDYASTRYSTLDQITTGNVARLEEVWSFTTGIKDGHEGQPLVVGNTMYVVTPFPNRLFAFDLTKPGFPKKWEYVAPIDPAAPGKA